MICYQTKRITIMDLWMVDIFIPLKNCIPLGTRNLDSSTRHTNYLLFHRIKSHLPILGPQTPSWYVTHYLQAYRDVPETSHKPAHIYTYSYHTHTVMDR